MQQDRFYQHALSSSNSIPINQAVIYESVCVSQKFTHFLLTYLLSVYR